MYAIRSYYAQVSWGTSPGMVTGVDQVVPDPRSMLDEKTKQATQRALDYMGLRPNMPITEIAIDKVFIGSCTNGVTIWALSQPRAR